MADWFDNVPVPMDANGCVVPLDTRELVYKGETKEVYSFLYSIRLKCWFVEFWECVDICVSSCTMPDSWERLMEDLDRAAGTFGSNTCACSYLTGDANTECSECKRYEKVRGCTQIMLADVARRIGALRKENGNGD